MKTAMRPIPTASRGSAPSIRFRSGTRKTSTSYLSKQKLILKIEHVYCQLDYSSFFLNFSQNEDFRRYQHGDDDDLLDGQGAIREENIQEEIDYVDDADNDDNSEDEVEGEDLMENMDQDYRQ